MELLTQNWTFIRALKVIIGALCLIGSAIYAEPILILVGLYLIIHGFLNAGCGKTNCSS